MSRIFDHTRSRILQLHPGGMPPPEIQSVLADGGNIHTVKGIMGVITRFEKTKSLSDAPRPHPSMLSLACCGETGKTIGLTTIRDAKRRLGWVDTGPKYCQLIRNANRIKRLEYVSADEQFYNVIFSDECSVMLEQHATLCFRHVDSDTGEPSTRKLKPRPKHPTKVHVWAGMSKCGTTEIKIFEGIMDQDFYQELLRDALIPFVRAVYPDGHRFMQDNDPKHTSRRTKTFMLDHGINWWPTPAESTDLNPIEHIWHEMKHFMRKEHKATMKEQLIAGLKKFWKDKMSPEKYIGNLSKALIKVIECEGRATGY